VLVVIKFEMPKLEYEGRPEPATPPVATMPVEEEKLKGVT